MWSQTLEAQVDSALRPVRVRPGLLGWRGEKRDTARDWISGMCGQIFRQSALVAGAWTERKKIFHGGSFLKLADDNMDIQNPEAQNRELSGF